MNMINTDLWEKYGGLLNEAGTKAVKPKQAGTKTNKGKEKTGPKKPYVPSKLKNGFDVLDSMDGPKTDSRTNNSTYGQISKSKDRQLTPAQKYDNDPGFKVNDIVEKLRSSMDETAAFFCVKLLRNVLRSELWSYAEWPDNITKIAKELGYSDELILSTMKDTANDSMLESEKFQKLFANDPKWDTQKSKTNWSAASTSLLMSVFEKIGKKYGTYTLANPKYIEDPKEALERGVYFEPATLLIVHHENEELSNLTISKEYSLDYEDMSEDVNNIDIQWSFLPIGKEEYAYNTAESQNDKGFIIVKLDGTWNSEELSPEYLSYAINAYFLNEKNQIVMSEAKKEKEETPKSVRVVFKGDSLKSFLERISKGEQFPASKLDFSGDKSTIKISPDNSYIYKADGEILPKSIEFLSKIVSSAAKNELISEDFPSIEYVKTYISNSEINGMTIVWKKPTVEDAASEFWSLASTEFDRSKLDSNKPLISTYGRSFKYNTLIAGKEIEPIIQEIYKNSNEASAYVSAIENKWKSVDDLIFKEGHVLNGDLQQIAFWTFVINGLGKEYDGYKTSGAKYDEAYKTVYMTFRSSSKVFYTFEKDGKLFGKMGDKTMSPGSYTIDHIEGTHGNAYFGNLRLATGTFNTFWMNTVGVFRFDLIPIAKNDPSIVIKWALKYDNDYRVMLPIGTTDNLDEPLSIYNNFQNMFSLNITGTDSRHLDIETKPDLEKYSAAANKTATLYVRGITVFTGKKESRVIFAGVTDLSHAGYKIDGTDIDVNHENIHNIKNTLFGDGHNYQVAHNADGDTIQKIIDSRYSRVLSVLASNVSQNAYQDGMKQVPGNVNNMQPAQSITGTEQEVAPEQPSAEEDAMAQKQNYADTDPEQTYESTGKKGTLFSEIISDFVPNLNEDSASMIKKSKNNRMKQVMGQGQFQNLTLIEIADLMIKMYNESKKLSNNSEKTTTRDNGKGDKISGIEFGVRIDNDLLKEYEGTDLEDWLPAQYIDINSDKGEKSLEFDKSEKKWKVKPWKQARIEGAEVLRVSRLGRVSKEEKGNLSLLKTVQDASFIAGYPETALGKSQWTREDPINGDYGNAKISGYKESMLQHIMVASTWKEENCNITVNQERKPTPKDDTPLYIIVHHINGNQTDARAENLEWVNTRDNTIFDSGKAIALFRVIPGTREEVPLLAWPTKKDCKVIDPKTGKESNEYIDRFYGGTKQIVNKVKIPSGRLMEKALEATSMIGKGEAAAEKIIYILRNVVLLDRKDKERTPEERVEDIIGYERIINGNTKMINDSNGKPVVIPDDLKQVESYSIPEMYLRGNINNQILNNALETRPDGPEIKLALNRRLNRIKNLDDLTRIDLLNMNGYYVRKLDMRDQLKIWNIKDESGMLPEDRIKVVFNELLKGNVAMHILTSGIIKELYNIYINSEYSIFNGGNDVPTNEIDELTFEREASKYYYKTKKLLSNTNIYNVAIRKGQTFIPGYLRGDISYKEFLNGLEGNKESEEIIKRLRSIEQSVGSLSLEDKINHLKENLFDVRDMDEKDQDIIWNSRNGVLNSPEIKQIFQLIENFKVPSTILPKNTILAYMEFAGIKKDLDEFINDYDTVMRKKKSARYTLESKTVRSQLVSLLEHIDKLAK